MHTHTRTHAYTYTYTCIHIHVHMHTHTRTHAYTYTYTCIHIHLHMHTPTHAYTYTCIHLHIHTHAHAYTYTRIHIHATRQRLHLILLFNIFLCFKYISVNYFTQWSSWDPCSTTCGKGKSRRTRKCMLEVDDPRKCIGPRTDIIICHNNNIPCPGWYFIEIILY